MTDCIVTGNVGCANTSDFWKTAVGNNLSKPNRS